MPSAMVCSCSVNRILFNYHHQKGILDLKEQALISEIEYLLELFKEAEQSDSQKVNRDTLNKQLEKALQKYTELRVSRRV